MATSKKSSKKEEDEEEEEEDVEEESKPKQITAQPVNIAEPLFFWIIVLVLALFARFIVTYTNAFLHDSSAYTFLMGASNFFLLGSGTLILPLIVGAVIGAEVGLKARSMFGALKAGLLNGLYAGVVYVIAIIIIYEILVYAIPSSQITLAFLINNLVVPQLLILVGVIEIFAVLSHSRKVSS